ncbi:hypothetical protein SRHO_G00055110 [Serrasalmus rhombeus]
MYSPPIIMWFQHQLYRCDNGRQWHLLTSGMRKAVPSVRIVVKLGMYNTGTCLTNIDEALWRTLRVANGLKIPYVGYVLVNCMGIAQLPRQSPVTIPPQSEMIVWTQVSGHVSNQSCNVEPLSDNGLEWCVACIVTTLHGGRVPCRLCNPNPYPVEVPQHQTVVEVTEVTTANIKGNESSFFTVWRQMSWRSR